MPSWNIEDADAFEDAYQILSAIIAAYSGRIGRADAEEAARLRLERGPYVSERQRLRVDDRERVRQIIAEYPVVLRQVRGEG